MVMALRITFFGKAFTTGDTEAHSGNQNSVSALGDFFQLVKKCRIGNRCGFGAADSGFAFCAQGGYGEGHGDAVVVVRIQFCTVEDLVARDR